MSELLKIDSGTLLVFASILLATIVAGLIRVEKGTTRADRMLAAQLFGTASVGILILLSVALDMPSLLDVALAFALLSAIAASAFVKRVWRPDQEVAGEEDKR